MVSNSEGLLRWCLEKEQIEFDSPNEMLAEDYLDKASESLEVANLLEENEHYDWSVTASYYARYFALTALLRRCGFKVENHSCAIALFQFAFIEKGELGGELLDSIKKGKNNRVEKQYGISRTPDTAASKQREYAIEFVTELTGYLEGISQNVIEKTRNSIERLE